MKKLIVFIFLILIFSYCSYAKNEINEKISEKLLLEIKEKQYSEIPIIVILNESINNFDFSKFEGKIKYKYKSINGFSGKIYANKIENFAKNSEVIKIYYDEIISIPPFEKNINISLINSTQIIGANYVWENLGYSGKGIKVAVIDTGINYSHPDLGGGFGSGYKVIGGYDFVNNDNDPMDDNGHGTHVAGIIAANGNIKGVAPNASLYAVKVCDSSGRCSNSNIIAGIDWSIANNADIISMSLGGLIIPNDDFSDVINQIVNYAVEKGISVIVAAGNEGPGTGTISCPGCAIKVITVGASNSNNTIDISDDSIASFSSRGPSAFGRLDPEVVAPGVNINSTSISGSYVTLSGTSMATPFVSGAVALLKEAKPYLTPLEIREILMHTSENISGHVFEKGAGIINISKAITNNISIYINDNDRWEFSIIPGYNSTGKILIINNNSNLANLSFNIEEDATDLEKNNIISKNNFILPNEIIVEPNSRKIFKISFLAPQDAKPGIYGTTLLIKEINNNITYRIPISITIPLFGSGNISGLVNGGDIIYYKIKSYNGTSLNVTLTWNNANDDLDLYLFAPNGRLINYSESLAGTLETLSLSKMNYDEYWIVVYAYKVSEISEYNISVEFKNWGFIVSPNFWQGKLRKNENINLTFTITNDQNIKNNTNISVKYLKEGEKYFNTSNVNSGLNLIWSRNLTGLNTTFTKYLSASIKWNNYNNDIDLFFAYYNGSNWFFSDRFSSQHFNSILKEAYEEIKMIDIQEFLKSEKYTDIGLLTYNYNNPEDVNITVNLIDIAPWDAAKVSENVVNLSANEIKEINVTINSSLLEVGKTYNAIFSIYNSSYDFATINIEIEVLSYSVCKSGCDFTSIQEAINNATDGETIYVYSGIYNENLIINKSINLIGENQYTTIINASEIAINISANYASVSNFNINTNSNIGIYLNANNSKISENFLNTSNKIGIYLENVKNNNIEKNVINSYESGLILNSSVENLIKNNFIYNSSYGILLENSSNNLLINNTLLNNTYEFFSKNDSINNSAINTNISFIISFNGKDFGIKEYNLALPLPFKFKHFNKTINISNTSLDSWFELNVSYSDEEVRGMNESKVSIYKWNFSDWNELDNVSINTEINNVYVNTSNFGILSLLGIDDIGPLITIHSPENKVYNSNFVDLKVSANEDVSSWWYSIGKNNITFIPNITLQNLENKQYILYVWANDIFNNTGFSSISFTINVQQNYNIGDGSFGGGVTGSFIIENKTNISEYTVPPVELINIEKVNNSLTIILEKSSEIGIENISFIVLKPKYNLSFYFYNYTNESFKFENLKVYKFIRIETKNINDNEISNVSIIFKVSKNWILENNIDENKIYVYRFNKTWEKLQTELIKYDKDFIYYNVLSPGLSSFVIAGEEKTKILESEINITSKKEVDRKYEFLILLIIVFIVIVFVILYKKT
ncbi:MAG: S8 family serine peptidase [Candidatus Aenigmatarchaeota archaeon]